MAAPEGWNKLSRTIENKKKMGEISEFKLSLHPLCFDTNPHSGFNLGEMATDIAQSLNDCSSFQTYRNFSYVVVATGEV